MIYTMLITCIAPILIAFLFVTAVITLITQKLSFLAILTYYIGLCTSSGVSNFYLFNLIHLQSYDISLSGDVSSIFFQIFTSTTPSIIHSCNDRGEHVIKCMMECDFHYEISDSTPSSDQYADFLSPEVDNNCENYKEKHDRILHENIKLKKQLVWSALHMLALYRPYYCLLLLCSHFFFLFFFCTLSCKSFIISLLYRVAFKILSLAIFSF